jgi:hypothetical protein
MKFPATTNFTAFEAFSFIEPNDNPTKHPIMEDKFTKLLQVIA